MRRTHTDTEHLILYGFIISLLGISHINITATEYYEDTACI